MNGVIRNSRVLLNIKLSSLTRVVSIGLNLLLVPLLLDFLGETNYGVWLTISSFLGWSTLLDLGIGNGLKNRLAETLANKDYSKVQSYTASAYFMLSVIALAAFIVFSSVAFFLDWEHLLNVEVTGALHLKWMVIIFFGLFCIKVVLNQIINITSAKAFTSLADVVNLLINVSCLILILSLSNLATDRLFVVVVGFGAIPVLVLLGVSIWAFSGPYKHFFPSRKAMKMSLGKDIMSLGSRFFLIQISGIILFSTDNFIISHFIEPAAVAPYHIAFRYFGVVITFFSILCTPIWPAYTNAYELGDLRWIKRTTEKLIKVWILVQVLLVAMFIASPWVYETWVGNEVHIPWQLSLVMLVYVSALTWGTIFVTFINSVGKLKLQTICSLLAGVVNIPLSIFFIRYTDLGSAGVMLATIICLFYGPVLSVIQYRRILTRRAKGIWSR